MNGSLILLLKKNIPLFSPNAKINKMSWISFISVVIGSIAITCTLAVINGTSSLVKQTLTTFDSDIKISNKQNKYFNSSAIDIAILKKISHVKDVNKILEETASLEYNKNFCIANVLGVENYNEKLISKTAGKKSFVGAECIVGLGIKNKLYISRHNVFDYIKIKVPKKKFKTAFANKIYNTGSLIPVGVFSVEQRYDDNFVLTSLRHLQKITKNKNLISDLEISVDDEKNINSVKTEIENILNPDYKVVTKTEKQKFLAKALNIEKFFTILALSVVFVIALLNLLFILSMVVLQKKNDIRILKILGETKIFSLFFSLGTLLGFLGSIIGAGISAWIIFLQNKFGFIKVGVDSLLVQSYPMEIIFYEYLAIIFFLTTMSCLLSIYPARKACKI
ncbi:MAG: hypothetical protein LBD32_02020 [Cytophagales bacterium]|jgi:lipoprotein-releasing system permease protein|nr:hypothetical protein [Cytophagales bacterium]